jgi:hypothetical protein
MMNILRSNGLNSVRNIRDGKRVKGLKGLKLEIILISEIPNMYGVLEMSR